MINVKNVPGVYASRFKFQNRDYVVLPGTTVKSIKWDKFKIDLYCQLTSHFGYAEAEMIMTDAGRSNYGNLLFNNEHPDYPPFLSLNDSSTSFRLSENKKDFPSSFYDYVYMDYKLLFQNFLDSEDNAPIKFAEGTTCGYPLFLKSASSKVDLVKRYINNTQLIKEIAKSKDMNKLALITSHIGLNSPVRRIRSDKASIIDKDTGEPVSIDNLNLDYVENGLKSGLYIKSKDRLALHNNKIVMKKYEGSTLLNTPSRLANVQDGGIGATLQGIATYLNALYPNFKITFSEYLEFFNYDDPTLELGLTDFGNFDKFWPWEYDKAFLRAAYDTLPYHIAFLIDVSLQSQLPRYHDGDFFILRNPFEFISILDPKFELHHTGMGSGNPFTSCLAKHFSKHIYQFATKISSSELENRLTRRSGISLLIGGDDNAHKHKIGELDKIINILNKYMDVKIEKPGKYLGYLFYNSKEGNIFPISDLASFVKGLFNPESKSPNDRLFYGSMFQTIKLFYSNNPAFFSLYKIINKVFIKHFGIDIDTVMKHNSDVYLTKKFDSILEGGKITNDELTFLLNPKSIHYLDLKLRDQILSEFFINSLSFNKELYDFLKGK